MLPRFHLRSVALLLMLALMLSSTSFRVQPVLAAADILVNDPSDVSNSNDGRCTFREAIVALNKTVASGTQFGECAAGSRDTIIRFMFTGTITLSSSLPPIERSVTIIGGADAEPGAEPPITIDGIDKYRILVVRAGTVRIQRIHFTHGLAQGGDGGNGEGGAGGGGGGAGMGGAIFIAGGSVTIENSRFTLNQARGGRGGDALATGSTSGHGGGGGGGMGAPGSKGVPGQGGRGGGGSPITDDGGVGGSGGGDAQDGQFGREGAGGGGAGPGTVSVASGKGGFGGYGGGGGGGGSGGPPSGFAGAGGFGGGGGGGSLNNSDANGGNGGGAYGGNGGNTVFGKALGGGGGGGGGLGGAIFAQRGTHTLIDNQFMSNSAYGGSQGAGVNTGEPGSGSGGAIFIAQDARVYNVSVIDTFPGSTNQAGNQDGVTANNINSSDNFQQKPLVSLSVIQQPSISGPTPGQFRISRRGPTDKQLVVRLLLDGTAKNVTDYIVEPAFSPDLIGTVAIPAGQTDALVSIKPYLDQLESAGRTISLEIVDSPNDYVIDSIPQATMTISSLPPPAWLVLLYVAADDIRPTPEKTDTLALSLNEPARDLLTRLVAMPSNPNLRVVVLFDGNKDTDSRILVRQPGTTGELLDVTALIPGSGAWPGFGYDAARDMVEIDMGRTDTLRSFITWARQTYPQAKHTMLSVIDHGGGWAPDFGSQQGQPKVNRYRLAGDGRGLSTDAQQASGRSLSTRNTGEVFAGLGDVGQFDLIFFDACLMGMVESAYEIQPYTRYFVAGQNLLWAELPYERYFGQITQDTTPQQLATNLITDYGTTLTEPHTIAAIDMAQIPELRSRISQLADALIAYLQANPADAYAVRDAYLKAQKFDYDVSMSIDDATDAYVDIRSLAQEIKAKNLSGSVNAAADEVVTAMKRAVLAPGSQVGKNNEIETNGGLRIWDLSRASGLSIYMPLGERDCRPTALQSQETPKLPCNSLGGEPMKDGSGEVLLYEDQFSYYVDPLQLAFTRDAKPWSELLKLLRNELKDQILDPVVKPGERPTSPPYLLQPAPLTVTTGAAQAQALEATLKGTITTGTWGNRYFLVTRIPGDYSKALTATQLLTETVNATETRYSGLVQGLDPVTTYYYKLVAERGSTKIFGQEQQFTTDYFRVCLPLIRNDTRPDLEIVDIQVVPAQPRVGQEVEVLVTIKNAGPGAVGPAFWVDLYVNPRTDIELKPNLLWNDMASLGAAWRVYGLQRGESMVLSTKLTGDILDPTARYSSFSRFIKEKMNRLVVQVDSYQPGDERGAVDELNEDNNIRPLYVEVISDQAPVNQ